MRLKKVAAAGVKRRSFSEASSIGVEHHDGDAQAGQEVDQVVAELGQGFPPVLQLFVQRRQLLVGRLQLLLRRLQLFVDTLQLLVAGQHLLVGRLELLVRGLLSLGERLLVLAGRPQLLLELRDATILGALGAGRRLRALPRHRPLPRRRIEEDQEAVGLAGRGGVDGNHVYRDALGLASPAPARLPAAGQVLGPGFVDGLAHVHEKPPRQHAQQVQARLAVGVLEQGGRVPSELDDVQVVVHQHPGRTVAGEQDPVGLPLPVRRRLLARRGRLRRRLPVRSHDPVGRGGHARLLRVDPPIVLQRHEPVRQGADGFRRAQHEEAVGVQGVVKRRQHPLLVRRLEIDEDVAAGDQVHAGERRILPEVVLREHALVAHVLSDLVAALALEEEAGQASRRHVGGDVLRIDARASLVDHLRRHVGAEDQHRRARARPARGLQQGDGHRVGLLAGGAARDPYPHRHAGGAILQHLRKGLGGQELEGIGVPEEGGHVDEEILVEAFPLRRVLLEPPEVLREALHPQQRHAAPHAAQEGGLLVRLEVDTGVLVQEREDSPEGVVVLAVPGGCGVAVHRRLEVILAGQAGDLARDALRRQHEVDASRGDGAAGHAVVARRAGVLGEGDAAGGLHRLASRRPVASGAGEDDRHRLAAPHLGQGVQEQVHRHVRAIGRLAWAKREPAVVDQHVLPGGDDVDVIGLYLQAFLGLAHGHGRGAGQQRGQDALVLRGQVLDEHEGHSRVGREVLEELAEGFQSARRGAYTHDGERLLLVDPGPGSVRHAKGLW
jgi:hypothetical protein